MKQVYFEFSLMAILEDWKSKNLREELNHEVIAIDVANNKVVFKGYVKTDETKDN